MSPTGLGALCQACQATTGDPIWSCLSGQPRPFLSPATWNKSTMEWCARNGKRKVKADPRGLSSGENGKVKPSDTIAEHDEQVNLDALFHGPNTHPTLFTFPSTVWSATSRTECHFGLECKYSDWELGFLFSLLMKGIIRTARWINLPDKDTAAPQLTCFMVKCLTAAPPFGPRVQITSFLSFHLNANGPLLEGRLCGHCCNHSILFCHCGKCFVCFALHEFQRATGDVAARVAEVSVHRCLSLVILIQAILNICMTIKVCLGRQEVVLIGPVVSHKAGF